MSVSPALLPAEPGGLARLQKRYHAQHTAKTGPWNCASADRYPPLESASSIGISGSDARRESRNETRAPGLWRTP